MYIETEVEREVDKGEKEVEREVETAGERCHGKRLAELEGSSRSLAE